LSLGDFLFLGRGEEMTGGRAKKALLSDAMEALIAAMYLDGGLDPTRSFIETHVVGTFALPEGNAEGSVDGAMADYKSALQEMAQALKLPAPRYFIVGEEGPEHYKTFTVEVRVGKQWVGQARGLSKKAAGQKAAEGILQQLIEWGR
jgi:ribonuclease-3